MPAHRRPGKPSSPGADEPPRYTPGGRRIPPETTGQEPAYLAVHAKAKTLVVVRLRDGTELTGTIGYYDRDVLKLSRDDAPDVLVRKDDIQYLCVDEPRRRRRRHRPS